VSGRAIRTDHHVRTADGVVYRVRYVHEARGEAELVALDDAGGSSIMLPLAELRRVAKHRVPRVEGVPAERPRCAWCARPLKPSVDNHYSDEPQIWKRRIVRRTFAGWRAYEGVFDVQGCAIRFAGASYRAGFRRQR
jgi:hypothetical protein